MRALLYFASLLLASLLAACGDPAGTTRLDERVERPDAPPLPGFAECTVTTYRQPAASRNHQPPCSELALSDDPPTGGDHFGVWASFGTYDAPVPWGFLVHSLEHGAVVLAYRCEDECDDVLAEYAAIAASIDDPVCRGEDVPSRVIIVPDPELPVPIAALAWEHAYLATCLDPASLRAFVDAHYANAPEDLCVPGASSDFCD